MGDSKERALNQRLHKAVLWKPFHWRLQQKEGHQIWDFKRRRSKWPWLRGLQQMECIESETSKGGAPDNFDFDLECFNKSRALNRRLWKEALRMISTLTRLWELSFKLDAMKWDASNGTQLNGMLQMGWMGAFFQIGRNKMGRFEWDAIEWDKWELAFNLETTKWDTIKWDASNGTQSNGRLLNRRQ